MNIAGTAEDFNISDLKKKKIYTADQTDTVKGLFIPMKINASKWTNMNIIFSPFSGRDGKVHRPAGHRH